MSPAERLRAAAAAAPQVIQPHKVALAVAAWLDLTAKLVEEWGEAWQMGAERSAVKHALAVADALLQTQATAPPSRS